MSTWNPIPDRNNFEASSEGHIRDKRTGAYLKEIPLNNGYLQVYCQGYGSDLVHRLVCSAFHPNSDPKNQVNHINGIITDNRPSNLEWISLGDNVRDFWNNPIFKPKQIKRKEQISKCMQERIWITDGHVNYRIPPDKLKEFPSFRRGQTRWNTEVKNDH